MSDFFNTEWFSDILSTKYVAPCCVAPYNESSKTFFLELHMELSTLALVAAGVVLLGSAVTYLIAAFLPLQVAVRAQQHGRFAGLTAQEARVRTGKPIATSHREARKETVNAF
jgi:hypothetical protein